MAATHSRYPWSHSRPHKRNNRFGGLLKHIDDPIEILGLFGFRFVAVVPMDSAAGVKLTKLFLRPSESTNPKAFPRTFSIPWYPAKCSEFFRHRFTGFNDPAHGIIDDRRRTARLRDDHILYSLRPPAWKTPSLSMRR
jgi:hypothetical protein